MEYVEQKKHCMSAINTFMTDITPIYNHDVSKGRIPWNIDNCKFFRDGFEKCTKELCVAPLMNDRCLLYKSLASEFNGHLDNNNIEECQNMSDEITYDLFVVYMLFATTEV